MTFIVFRVAVFATFSFLLFATAKSKALRRAQAHIISWEIPLWGSHSLRNNS